MIIKVHQSFEPLLDDLNDRQKIFLAFFSELHTRVPVFTWINLHPSDFDFILGNSEVLYHINSVGMLTEAAGVNQTARRIMGETLAEEFEWRFENKQNVLWRSKSLQKKHSFGKGIAWSPTVPTEITDPKAKMLWIYLLGRLKGNTIMSNFRWHESGPFILDREVLEAMGEPNR